MKFTDRTGETRTFKCGLKGTIIAYHSSNNIDIQFEDGVIVKHKNYWSFKNDNLGHPLHSMKVVCNKSLVDKNEKKYVGMSNKMSNGMSATIIAYRGAHDIDVEFEDGYVGLNKTMTCFKRGTIFNPNTVPQKTRLGETKIMNCGMEATIIKYESSIDLDVQFADGYVVQKRRYTEFKKGVINNPNYKPFAALKIGETKMMNCGMSATIIAYRNSTDLDVQFEDGTIVEHRTLPSFNDCEILNPNLDYNRNSNNASKRIGESKRMNNGLVATIVVYKSKEDIDVQFEDGSITCNKRYSDFKASTIASPNLSAKGISHFCGFECQVIIRNENNVYYKVKHEDGFEGIMTPQEMLSYVGV